MAENPAYLSQQLITYLGNKRSLLNFIGDGLQHVKTRLQKTRISAFDIFSGSGIVARFLKKHTRLLYVNDLEDYSRVINRCYLANESAVESAALNRHYRKIIRNLENKPLKQGFISELYSPENDEQIKPRERVFYTKRNAMYLDTARQLISQLPEELQPYLLAPLLSEASIHANTSGVFKGFYKCRQSGLGQFGGTNRDAILRIKGDIRLPFPIFSRYESEVRILQGDANRVAQEVPEIDLAYLDPPYNQHPYGSNYFMLNLLVNYQRPRAISNVSGIPENWQRSAYNKRTEAYRSFSGLIEKLRAKFLLISFNSEGFIAHEEMQQLLNTIGSVKVLETRYNTFRGSRNLAKRNIHVKEYLYLVEKY